MLLSQTTEYALRAVLFIASRHPSPVRASELASSLGLPRNYIGKTLGNLARAGVLTSMRGSSGGFRLSRPPEQITLVDVTRPFRAAESRRCLLGLGPCGSDPSCAVHRRWYPSAQMIDRFFDSTTIADLVATQRPATVASTAADHPLLQAI